LTRHFKKPQKVGFLKSKKRKIGLRLLEHWTLLASAVERRAAAQFVDRCSIVRRVCCCEPDRQKTSIDSGGHWARNSTAFSTYSS